MVYIPNLTYKTWRTACKCGLRGGVDRLRWPMHQGRHCRLWAFRKPCFREDSVCAKPVLTKVQMAATCAPRRISGRRKPPPQHAPPPIGFTPCHDSIYWPQIVLPIVLTTIICYLARQKWNELFYVLDSDWYGATFHSRKSILPVVTRTIKICPNFILISSWYEKLITKVHKIPT